MTADLLTRNVEELLWFEGARLVLVDLLEVLVQLLQFLLSDYPQQRHNDSQGLEVVTVKVLELLLLSLKFGSHLI